MPWLYCVAGFVAVALLLALTTGVLGALSFFWQPVARASHAGDRGRCNRGDGAWLSWRFFAVRGGTIEAPSLVTVWIASVSTLVLLASVVTRWARAFTLLAVALTIVASAIGGFHAR